MEQKYFYFIYKSEAYMKKGVSEEDIIGQVAQFNNKEVKADEVLFFTEKQYDAITDYGSNRYSEGCADESFSQSMNNY